MYPVLGRGQHMEEERYDLSEQILTPTSSSYSCPQTRWDSSCEEWVTIKHQHLHDQSSLLLLSLSTTTVKLCIYITYLFYAQQSTKGDMSRISFLPQNHLFRGCCNIVIFGSNKNKQNHPYLINQSRIKSWNKQPFINKGQLQCSSSFQSTLVRTTGPKDEINVLILLI